jgi:hypothetical protein
LTKYDNYFVPFTSNHTSISTSDWKGVACGNFDNDASDEVISVKNSDGQFYCFDIKNGSFSEISKTSNYSNSYNWAGIATGNFFGDTKDEFVAISNNQTYTSNGVYAFKCENGVITEQTKHTGWGPASNWAGIVSGNFISGGYDDFITVRNYNKEAYVCKFNGTTIQYVRTNVLSLPSNCNIVSVASGNLDSDAKDEIIILVNSSTASSCGFYIYKIDDVGNLSLVAQSTGWGTVSEWRGLCVGDFDGDGKDEFIVHRNFDGQFKLYSYSSGSIINIGTEYFPNNQTYDNILSAGNVDALSTNDELISFRNFDGGMIAFNYVFPLFSKSNIIIEDDKSITDGQVIDINLDDKLENIEIKLSLVKFEIYPNPNCGILHVKTSDVSGLVKYRVLNIDGKMIKEGEIYNDEIVDINDCKNGLYIICLKYKDFIYTEKFILEK